MPKKETKLFLIITLFIDALFVGTFLSLYNFTKGQVVDSVNKENSIKTELKKDELRSLMKEDLNLSKFYQTALADYVLPKGGTVDFIKTIEQIVLNSELKSDIKSVSNEAYDKGTAIGAELIRVNMNVIGKWENVQFFLKSLENYPLKITINKMSLNKFSDYFVKGKKIPQWAGALEFTVLKMKDTK